MPVVASELIAYASLNMPEDDTATSGGAIDPDTRVVFDQIVVDDTLRAVSSNASDTATVTIEARLPNGTVVSEAKALTGTTDISFNTLGTVDRVLQVTLSADAAGIVTIKTSVGTVIGTIPIGERGFLAVHREATGSSSSTQDFYYKIFLKNTNSTFTLQSGVVTLVEDPPSRVTFALAAAINDSGSVSNRKTSPGLTFNTAQKSVPATLTAGAAIGVWLKFSHPAGEGDLSSDLILSLTGIA